MGNADQIRLEVVLMMLAFPVNEIRKNGRFCFEAGHDPTYVGYGAESRPKGGWQVCKWTSVWSLTWSLE